ncbi:TonB-dependent receptor plug domain protein, partial [mine drainage metagenome]
MKIRPHAFAVAVCAALALPAHAQHAAGNAFAQTKPDKGQAKSLATIVVTVTKRAELMQDVPIAISVVTSQDIRTAGVTSAADIASLVPGFVMVPLFGSSGYNPVIRGLSTTIGGPNVGFFVDG